MFSYWVSTKWGTGLVTVDATGIMQEPVAPIFRKWIGSKFLNFVLRHNVRVAELTKEV